MLKAPLDLAKARILVSNDDGIDAPGLKRLENIAAKLAAEVWTVAPESEHSATGHSLTLRRPLRIRKLGPRRFAVDGTPTDCIMLAVNQIMDGGRPDLVLSGINRGGNVAEDVTYSGTIAAAMEATLFGIPSIALSQQMEGEMFTGGGKEAYATAEAYAARVIRRVVKVDWPRDVLINVNFPPGRAKDVKGIEVTHEGRRKIGDDIREGTDPRGDLYYWIGAQKSLPEGTKGTDLDAIARGMVSVTPLSINLTHRPTMRALKGAFGKK